MSQTNPPTAAPAAINAHKGIPPMKIDWKNLAITFAVAIAAIIVYPKVRPYLQKIPVIGAWL